MQPRVVAFKILHLHFLNRLNYRSRNQVQFMVYAAKVLYGVQKQGCTRTEQVRSLGGYNSSVSKLDSRGRHTSLKGALFCGNCYTTVICSYLSLIHQKVKLVDFRLSGIVLSKAPQSCVIAADYLLARSFAAGIIVIDAVACHVYAHVCRRLIRVIAVDAFENRIQYRENLDIAVIVYGCFAIGFKMERVNHVDVVQIGGCSLVGKINRVF